MFKFTTHLKNWIGTMLTRRRFATVIEYINQENELKSVCPQLISEKYSHPYYFHIPDEWFTAKHRILVVGEEGFGYKQFDLSISEAQAFNKNYLLGQLTHGADNHSPFWQRVRKIAACTDVSIAWTNLDMIHHSGRKGCALKKCERMALHQTPTPILSEEIRILEPDIVVYFGWYGISLQAEFPEVFQMLYPGGLRDYSQWKEEKMKVINAGGRNHVFTYHPGWGQRVKGYEERVFELIKKTMASHE